MLMAGVGQGLKYPVLRAWADKLLVLTFLLQAAVNLGQPEEWESNSIVQLSPRASVLSFSRSVSPLSPTLPRRSLSLSPPILPNRRMQDTDTESVSSAYSFSSHKGFEIPKMWRPSIMMCIREKNLTMQTRNEIVRDLCTHMYANLRSESQKPTAAMCRDVATKLVKGISIHG